MKLNYNPQVYSPHSSEPEELSGVMPTPVNNLSEPVRPLKKPGTRQGMMCALENENEGLARRTKGL